MQHCHFALFALSTSSHPLFRPLQSVISPPGSFGVHYLSPEVTVKVIAQRLPLNRRTRRLARLSTIRTFAMEHQRRIEDAESDFAARRQLVELLDVRMQVVMHGDEVWLKLTSVLGEGLKRLDLPPARRR
jgi:hypothetical protein